MNTLLGVICLSALTWVTAVPAASIAWFFTRKKVAWSALDFVSLISSPSLWIMLMFFLPAGKSLSNVFAEPFFLGLGLSILYLAIFLISKRNPLIKTIFLTVASTILTLAVYFFVPILAE
ncbi:MAG: hypothetical protein ABH891_10235 [Candidatus Omnitrophota bacterium]